MDDHRLIPLDLWSEGLLVWESKGHYQNDFVALSFTGKSDVSAWREALRAAQENRPQFHSYLQPSWKRGRFYFNWLIESQPVEMQIVDRTNLPALPNDLDSWLPQQLDAELHSPRDLTQHYPVSCFLFLLPNDTGVFLLSFHHVAGDAATVYGFFRDVFARYHQLTKDRKPHWADAPALHSLISAQPVEPFPKKEFWRREMIKMGKYPLFRVASLISTPSADRGQWMIRRTIADPKLQMSLRDRGRRENGGIVDLFLAAAKLALQEWNENHGSVPDVMFHGLAVNQRGRNSNLPSLETNPMSLISIPTRPSMRRDPLALLQYVIAYRREHLDCGYDLAVSQAAHDIIGFMQWMPIRLRHFIQRKTVFDPPGSFFLTNPGILWPQLENGRSNGKTAIDSIGDLKPQNVHLYIASTERNHLALILQTFNGRLDCIFSFGRRAVNESDANAFADLVMHKTLAYL